MSNPMVIHSRLACCIVSLLAPVLSGQCVYAQSSAVEENIQDFLDFATYTEGAITPEQVVGAGVANFIFIDTRSAEQFRAGHIPGASNIEWREILAKRDSVPRDRSVVLYCDTGLLSSKAHMALRLLGYDENLKVLFGGYNNWTTYKETIRP